MKNNKLLLLPAVILFLFSIVAVSGTLQAQNIDLKAPLHLKAEMKEDPNSHPMVKLSWVQNDKGTQPNMFGVYIAQGKTTDTEEFDRVELVKVTNSKENLYYFRNLANGIYSFFVTSALTINGVIYESDPSAIVHLEVKYEEKPYVRIVSEYEKWVKPGDEYKYHIKAQSNINCPIILDLVEGPKGMALDASTGILTWNPAYEGEYKAKIKAYLECDKDVVAYQEMTIIVGINNNHGYVRIVSEPITKAEPGDTYKYDVDAESNVKCPIVYDLIGETPKGMTIDSESGVITWHYAAEGVYKIIVRAYLECDKNVFADQKYVLTVGSGHEEACAVISGKLKFDSQNILPIGKVIVYSVDPNKNNYGNKPLYTAELQNGIFTVDVPEGVYVIYFVGHNFVSEWFDNATSMREAELLGIKCGEKVTLEVTVDPIPVPNYYTVTGNVHDKLTNKPVQAVVHFMPVGQNKDGKNLPPNTALSAKTNEAGYYSLRLPDSFDYTAMAVPTAGSDYQAQYYDRVYSPYEADIIVVNKDVKGINFPLEKKEGHKNGFTGLVTNTSNEPIKAVLIAYLIEPKSNTDAKYKYIETTETDDDGLFWFEGLVPGKYTVLSIPLDRIYVPGYYNDNGIVTQKWREAGTIEVDEAMITIVYNFIHENRKEWKGSTTISGRVGSNGESTKSSKDDIQGYDPLNGAFVFITDTEGNVIDYGFTQNEGNFKFTDLAEGSYMLTVDMVGYDSETTKITTDVMENSDPDIEITLEALTTGLDDPEVNSLERIYPQPAADFVTIEFPGIQNNTKLMVYDLLGRMILSQDINGQTVKLNTNGLHPGTYIIKTEKSLSYPLVIIK